MSGGIYSYDESVATTAHDDLAGVVSGLQSSLDDLTNFVAQVKSNWQGDEQEIYAGIQGKWDAAAATVNEILGSVRGALGQNTSSVQEMRGQVRGALQG